MFLTIFLFDKAKNFFMPYDPSKYKRGTLDFYWRTAAAASVCQAATLFATYPLDLIHTRISVDMSKKGQKRLFSTTFDCFNRTHLDEGRWGLYKGFELAILSSVFRAALTLPLYETLKSTEVMKKQNDQSDEGTIDR